MNPAMETIPGGSNASGENLPIESQELRNGPILPFINQNEDCLSADSVDLTCWTSYKPNSCLWLYTKHS